MEREVELEVESESTGVGKLVGIAVFLIVAVCGLALLRFDVLGVRSMIMGAGDDDKSGVPNTGTKDPERGDPRAADTLFDPQTQPALPEGSRPAAALPQRLTITRKVDGHSADLELVLVPAGWFIMGEDDPIISNQPKRWVWCNDYYIARTEMTNDQYYAFILAGGYSRSQYWLEAAWNYIQAEDLAGTELLGWGKLTRDKRMWGLASPAGDATIEVRNADGSTVRRGTAFLVLPAGRKSESYFSFDSGAGKALIKARDKWLEIDGDAVAASRELRADGHLRYTDDNGRIQLQAQELAVPCTLVCWPDGPKNTPLSSLVPPLQARAAAAPKMPAVSMSWFEADACARFWGGQLPWECWWEKAARGVDGRAYPWGADLELRSDGAAGQFFTDRANIGRGDVMEVGRFATGASPYGLLDMTGNVSEWVGDGYVSNMLSDPRYEGADPHLPPDPTMACSERGSHYDDSDSQTPKVYNRRSASPYARDNRLRGFRIAFTPEAALKAAK